MDSKSRKDLTKYIIRKKKVKEGLSREEVCIVLVVDIHCTSVTLYTTCDVCAYTTCDVRDVAYFHSRQLKLLRRRLRKVLLRTHLVH